MIFDHDAQGQLLQTITEDSHGNGVMRDALGQMTGHYTSLSDGSRQVFSPLGQLVETIRPLAGGGHMFQNALGQTTMSSHEFGGKQSFRDNMGQLLMQHDPCTGSFTNALGQLAFRRYSV